MMIASNIIHCKARGVRLSVNDDQNFHHRTTNQAASQARHDLGWL